MPRYPEAWITARRHPRGKGVYVYVDADTLEEAGLPADAEAYLIRRYVLGRGDILIRVRAMTRDKLRRGRYLEDDRLRR